MKYVTQDSTMGDDVDITVVPDKTLIDKEKQNLEKMKVLIRYFVHGWCDSMGFLAVLIWLIIIFQGVLQMFLHEHVDLQIATLYAAQVFCYSHGFPKGEY